MPHETEAACLLRTGASYPGRLGIVADGQPPIFVGMRRGAASIYFGDEPIFHFDLEGRWQRAYLDGVHYLKGLDGTTRALDRVRDGANLILKRRTLSFAESGDLDASARSAALDVAAGLGRRSAIVEPPGPARPIETEELQGFLDRVASWDAAAWFSNRERYLSTYGAPPFVPPDASTAVLLQATLGDRGPTFGERPPSEFYRRSDAEFRRHASEVARLWGRRAEQAKVVYLAGDALWHEPVEAIRARLDVSSESFPGLPATGFLADLSAPLPGPSGWRALGESGLRSLTIGVESGDPELLAGFGKAWAAEILARLVADLASASIDARIIVLAGFPEATAHIERTSELLERVPFAPGSVLYLIDRSEIDGSRRGGFAEDVARFKGRLGPSLKAKGAKLAPYSLEKRWN